MRDKIKKIRCGNTERWSFSKIKPVLEIPYLIELQKDSFKRFITEGIREVFADFSPIVDYSGKMSLEFLEHSLEGDCKYSVKECKDRDATYTAPLRVKVRLTQTETGRKIEQSVFMGDFPMMTDNGTFIINGAERVIVSQLVRSPGVYNKDKIDKNGALRFDTTNIPNRGAWLEWEQDQSNVLWVHVDRKRKITGTVLIRALGYGTNAEIEELFDGDEMIMTTALKDTADSVDMARAEVYQRMRPGENPPPSGLEALINSLFFDPKRYDLARVGRYKFNKKLSLANRITGCTLAEPVIHPETGEILAAAGETLDEKKAWAIQNAGVNEAYIAAANKKKRFKVIGNNTVKLNGYIDCDPKEIGILENVYYPNLRPLIEEAGGDMEMLKNLISVNIERLVLKHLSVEDIVATVSYNLGLAYGIGETDNIDHLSNRRVRSAGELLQNQFKIGISRLERVIVQKMMSIAQDSEDITPQMLVNIRPLASAIKEFFGSSQLSQFMDQPNPIAELTHKRKLSALGPGGLNRERAGFDVRDVHHSHYGRMCPIETPEGQNIGLISSLSTFARVNEYGFIEAPYRRVDKIKGVVTDEVAYMTADEEDKYIVAQANEPLTDKGAFINERVNCRERDYIREVPREQVDYMDVSPMQLVSVATALIPFLENDDTNRALMGSNMQRQAVPLLCPEAPIIGTGIEHTVAHDSGVMILSKNAGTVTYVTADKIIVTNEQGEEDVYYLQKFARSNQGTCINQKPIVHHGQRVKADDILADGPATDNGELALGRNILIGFMTWEGYNYEDAILISEDLIKKDMFTTIHIEEYEIEARDTKLGEELIPRDIPNLSDDMLKYLDEDGIIMIGAEVRSGDILVGKVTPKGETELTPEERLLRAIFGEKAREVRDTSLKVPHGESGIVVDVKIFTRENKDELSPGVNKLVRVYVAQKRKISVGDKMAGRHGNKGVISRILPREDMPFMADGTPLQIVLNPLGVPSRMNIGQVLEVHLGFIAKMLDMKIATPVFDGASENDIKEMLSSNGLPDDGKIQLYDGRTGDPFENKVTVGYMYMLKLVHLVDDKIHARSTGPYSLVTQQPLGGKAQFGGQRFGEMEVWALESYGAANILQEILTVKSDDVVGRLKAYESIVKGANIAEPGIPESFKVLRKELQSLALDVELLTEDKEVINISELYDDDKDFELSREREDNFKEVALNFSLDGGAEAHAPVMPVMGAEEELNFNIFADDEALNDDEALFDEVGGGGEDADDDDTGDIADLMGSIFNLPMEDDDEDKE